jgi:glycosyltransferase involved in cell wall biosynthesis
VTRRVPAWTGTPGRRGRRRILHVAPVLWSGAGEVITTLCESQSASSDVAILTSARTGIDRDWPAYRARLSRAGVVHAQVETLSRDSGRFWSSVERVTAILAAWPPTVVHTHAGVPACVVAHAAIGRAVRHVAHMYSWNPERPEWMNRMDAWGFAQADLTICSAIDYARILRERGVPARRLTCIPWGVRVDREDLASHEEPRDSRGRFQAPRLGFVGRVEPRKGQLELVEAVGRLRSRLPALHLDLVGPIADQRYGDKVLDAIRRLGLGGSVELHGHLPDAGALRATWALFVSLSADEGQGLAVQEAMAAGLPVVALDAPGLRDYLRDGRTAIVVPSRQPAVVADAIGHALSTPDRVVRMAWRGRKLIRERFSWERCLASIDRAYRA